MFSEIEVPLSPGGNSIYFWERLSMIGDVLVISGKYLQPLNASISINKYAKKRRWVVNIERFPGPKMRLTRVG